MLKGYVVRRCANKIYIIRDSVGGSPEFSGGGGSGTRTTGSRP